MTIGRFNDLLKAAIGLEVSSIGASAVERAVRKRVAATGCSDLDAYWSFVGSTPAEVQALVEDVVVPETWFFRDRQAFAALAKLAVGAWASRPAGRPLRLLSLPCSTGEEPYTIAMALLDAGLPAAAFQIDAVDISHRALEHARCGIYGRNSFRGADLGFRESHFVETAKGCRVSDEVRAAIRFAQGNLFDPRIAAEAQPYDFVFCRNLLIYFDAAGQRRSLDVLRRLLAPQGTLFLGHAEAGLVQGSGLASARIPCAFAFRAEEANPAPERKPAAVSAAKPSSVHAIRPQPSIALRPPAPRAAPAVFRPTPVGSSAVPNLRAVRELADAGRLLEAAKLGEVYLRTIEPAPEALYLLGVISDAAGDGAAAARYYRQTIYLDPGHQEALDHLALLLERQGDRPGAQRIRDRARRLDQRRAVG